MERTVPSRFFGGAIQMTDGALDSDSVVVEGPAVILQTAKDKITNTKGVWFSKNTYFGKHQGNGVDAMFQHGRPILYKAWAGNERYMIPDEVYQFFEGLSKHTFTNAVETQMDKENDALTARLVLSMRNEYEKWVAKRAKQEALGWSAGTAPHTLVMNWKTGHIDKFPIIEMSLTPTPAAPETKANQQDFNLQSFLEGTEYDLSRFSRESEKKIVDLSLYFHLGRLKGEQARLDKLLSTN